MVQGWSPFDCRQPKIGPVKLDGPMTFGYGIDAVGLVCKCKVAAQTMLVTLKGALVVERDDFEAALAALRRAIAKVSTISMDFAALHQDERDLAVHLSRAYVTGTLFMSKEIVRSGNTGVVD
jgi:hypothetical protein